MKVVEDGKFVDSPFEIVDEDRFARIPHKAHAGDAGWDLAWSPETDDDFTGEILFPGQRMLLGTNLRLAEGAIDGGVGLLCPRSGLAHKSGISIVNSPGVVDSSYRGEIKVNLINLGWEPFEVTPGDRIAQLVVVPVMGWTNVGDERGEGGHGSSGR